MSYLSHEGEGDVYWEGMTNGRRLTRFLDKVSKVDKWKLMHRETHHTALPAALANITSSS